MISFTSPLVAARYWLKIGFSPIPVPYRQKKPLIEEWPDLELSEPELPKHFGARSNIGAVLGRRGEGDVDLDCREAILAWIEFMLETGCVFGRESKPRSHFFYRIDPPIASRKYIDPIDANKTTLIELRCRKKDGGIGYQTIVPGSVHESGEPIRFDSDGLVANVDAEDLIRAVARTAAACVIARHFPAPKGGRNDAFLALAGMLCRAGWSEEETTTFHRAIYRCLWPADPDFFAAGSEVEATFRRYAAGHQIYAYTKLCELIDQRAVNVALDWLGVRREQPPRPASSSTAAGDWRKPEPLQGALPPVPAFSEEFLPDAFRASAVDTSERMQCPLEYAGISLLVCLGGSVNRRAVIQPKANDTSWAVVGNVWGGIIGPSGFMKSPLIQATTATLRKIEAEWRKEHAAAQKEYRRQTEQYELRCSAWKDQYKRAFKNKAAEPEHPEPENEEPLCKRLIVNDTTFEALHEKMSANPAGLFLVRDELTGWLAQLDRQGREGDRSFFLECWNGDTSYTMDRIGRGSIHVPACCLSMLGGIQPSRLRSYLAGALEDGPTNDGLFQRFQLLVWPDTDPEWRYVDRPPHAEAEDQVSKVFRKLVALDAANPVRLRFAPAAQELFIAWLGELESKIRGGELHPALVSHLSKYRRLMPAMAMLFELADAAAGHSDGEQVMLRQAQRSAVLCECLESHARRIYSCIVTPQMRAAHELAQKIKDRKVGTDGSFSPRDVYMNGWSGLDTPEAVRQAAEVLEDASWLRLLPGETGFSTPGRPTGDRYQVNPRIWEC